MLVAALIRHLSDDQTQFVLSEVIVTGALVACSALSATCPPCNQHQPRFLLLFVSNARHSCASFLTQFTSRITCHDTHLVCCVVNNKDEVKIKERTPFSTILVEETSKMARLAVEL